MDGDRAAGQSSARRHSGAGSRIISTFERTIERRLPRLPWLDTTVGQILSLLIGGLVLTLAVVLWLTAWLSPDPRQVLRGPHSNAMQAVSLIQAMRAVPPPMRAVIAAGVHTPGLRITLGNPPICERSLGLNLEATALAMSVHGLLPDDPRVSVQACRSTRQAAVMDVRAADLGVVFTFNVERKLTMAKNLLMRLPLIASFLFLFVLVAVLSVWAVLRIIGPLQRLSRTVEQFGYDVAVAPAVAEGPREIRRAAQSFNQMQERISSAVRDRTRMLAAISHDLRTPITRLRLRTELEQSGEYRDKTLRDLDLMQRMVMTALDFLRGHGQDEAIETIDLGALLQCLCDEAGEAGADAAYQGEETICCACRPDALSRAVTNLIENACRYGNRARVTAFQRGDDVTIEVADDGPGIPDKLKQEALLPFSRLDSARAVGDGVGLGLAIVADFVAAHHGRLELRDGPAGGLVVAILLPRSIQPSRPSAPRAAARRALRSGDRLAEKRGEQVV